MNEVLIIPLFIIRDILHEENSLEGCTVEFHVVKQVGWRVSLAAGASKDVEFLLGKAFGPVIKD